MSGSLNKVILVGNLGKNPEVRSMQSGDKVANFNIATTEKWTDRDGNRQEKTEWHRVVIFGKVAEVAEKYLNKGSSVLIEGKLQTRKWTDNNGQDKYTTEVVVQGFGGKMVMLGGRGDGGGQVGSGFGGGNQGGDYDGGYGGNNNENSGNKPNNSNGPADYSADLDDEIPF